MLLCLQLFFIVLSCHIAFFFNLVCFDRFKSNFIVFVIQDVKKLTPLSADVISRQATINIGE